MESSCINKASIHLPNQNQLNILKGQRSKRYTLLSISAAHQPFHISICISTLPTQHTTFLSLIGRSWSAATTEGLLTYSLDVAMVFDPFDLAIDVTPGNIRNILQKGEFLKALMSSFRLNEQELILQVVETIPSQDSWVLIKINLVFMVFWKSRYSWIYV